MSIFPQLFVFYFLIFIFLNHHIKAAQEIFFNFPKYTITIKTTTILDDQQLIPENSNMKSSELLPLIHSKPIEIKPLCLPLHKILQDAISNDVILGRARSIHKHRSDWYSAPIWASNPNSNILRAPAPHRPKQITNADPRYALNPRNFFHSSSYFRNIKKPLFASKLITSKNKFIGKHSGKDFGNIISGDFHHSHPGGFYNFNQYKYPPNHIQNVNKQNSVNVHNRKSIFEGQSNTKNQFEKGFISSNLHSTPTWKTNLVTRSKRSALGIARLVIDPRNKLNLSKTAENVGAATRNIFEEEFSPVYHMRSSLSSANDAIYSLLNVRPSGLLIPCRYKIVDGNEASPIVGGINPALYGTHNKLSPETTSPDAILAPTEVNEPMIAHYDEEMMQRIGTILRSGIQWAHKSAEHTVDAMHHARQVVVAARKYWPKLLLPYASAVEVDKPTIGQNTLQNQDIVGTPKDPEFIGVGKMMDYFGMTNAKPDPSPRVGTAKFVTKEEQVLLKAKQSLGLPAYRQFITDIENQLNGGKKPIDYVGAPKLTPDGLKARLALERLKNSLKIQKTKADLKKLQPIKLAKQLILKQPIVKQKPPTPLISKPEKTPVLSISSVPKNANSLFAPLKLSSTLKNSDPKEKLVINTLKQLREKMLKNLKQNLSTDSKRREEVSSALNDFKNKETKTDHFDLAEKVTNTLKDLGEKLLKSLPQNNSTESKLKEEISSSPNKIKDKLFKKYHIKDKTEVENILGKLLTKLNTGVVGGVKHEYKNIDSIPTPVFTKEMKTPFLGLATKEEVEQYFKKIYCARCKL